MCTHNLNKVLLEHYHGWELATPYLILHRCFHPVTRSWMSQQHHAGGTRAASITIGILYESIRTPWKVTMCTWEIQTVLPCMITTRTVHGRVSSSVCRQYLSLIHEGAASSIATICRFCTPNTDNKQSFKFKMNKVSTVNRSQQKHVSELLLVLSHLVVRLFIRSLPRRQCDWKRHKSHARMIDTPSQSSSICYAFTILITDDIRFVREKSSPTRRSLRF